MSVREYYEAIREVKRVEEVLDCMRAGLADEIADLKRYIVEGEYELEDDRKNAKALGKKLKAKFATKVDDHLVFRLSRNQPIQILEITEE